MVKWSYYDKFTEINDLYLPISGEGDTMATQICTAVNKLIYKWYNDGDVFDNTYYLNGWCNDLSSYANWLYEYVPICRPTLNLIKTLYSGSEYEDLLKELADMTLNIDFLKFMEVEKQGTIYECNGQFEFVDYDDDDEEDW